MRRHLVFDKRTGRMEELPCDQNEPFDPMQMLRDCPECSAALARGEKPVTMTADDIKAAAAEYERSMAAQGIDLDALLADEDDPPPRPRHSIFGRRPRWRDLKRRG